VANQLISEATKTLFLNYFPKIEKLKKADHVTPYDAVVEWFTQNNALEIADETDEQTYLRSLQAIEPLKALIERYQPRVASVDLPFLMEFVLWALVEFKRLSKQKTAGGMSFNDLYDSLLKGI
jgi:magnesium chelatase subunit I